MVNKILICILAWLLYISSSSWWYFENKYYCKKQDSKIWVSQSIWDNYVKCFDLIKQIDQQRKLWIENIQKAQQYIKDGEDVEFYKNLQMEIKKTIDYGDLTKESIIKSMSAFEQDLFMKFKKILDYHVTKRLSKIDKYINSYEIIMNAKINEWDELGFTDYRGRIEEQVAEKIVIQNLLNSTNFKDLMPVVQFWYTNYYK